MSEEFTVTKGVKQGCSLSPCNFIIAVEVLAIAVRHNVKIKGITQNDVEKSINLQMTQF